MMIHAQGGNNFIKISGGDFIVNIIDIASQSNTAKNNVNINIAGGNLALDTGAGNNKIWVLGS